MSKEDFSKFYDQHVLKTPELKAKLHGAKDQPDFARIAIEEGSKLGLSFTGAEIGEVMNATEQKLHPGALSDDQLAGVVGGAGTATSTIQVTSVPKIGPAAGAYTNPVGGAVIKHAGDWGGCW